MRKDLWIVLSCLALVISGCFQNQSGTAIATFRSSPTITKIPATLTSMPSPLTTQKPEETPTRTTTPTSTKTVTWTPVPSLSPSEIKEFAQKVLTSDEICKLPCWANIYPGKTSLDAAQTMFNILAFSQSTYNKEKWSIFLPSPDMPDKTVGTTIRVEAGIITWIYALRYHYHLYQLLQTYGPPTEVWINADVNKLDHPDATIFELSLFYNDRNFVAAYEGTSDIDQNYNVCPSGVDPVLEGPSLEIWSVFQKKSYQQTNEAKKNPYIKLEEATGMDVQTFYELFREQKNESKCIQIPRNLPQ